ncbi:MAG: ABC transporter ATP-binding protein [Demequinaceae bacterium]|nr:ABC transporter ATP-binding protein [Demequinaceae bacterium]
MITTRSLTKRYGGTIALDDVDLNVSPGSIYGLAGPNGAGKTTLLGILAGLRRETSGELHIDARAGEIAVLPDTPRFDPWLTGREVVALARSLVDPNGPSGRVDEVLVETGLADAGSRRVGGYSRGMLQRLGIAATLVGRPRLVLLDEPASALDPGGRREVLDLIARLRGTATVLFSSHILADVQEVCDTVGTLDKGRLLFEGPLRDLLVGSAVPRYVVHLRGNADTVAARLTQASWVSSAEARSDGVLFLEVTSLADAEERLAEALAAAKAVVVSYGPEEVSLERAFLELTGGRPKP